MYVVILGVILFIAGSLTYSAFSSRVEIRFARFRGHPPVIIVEESPSADDLRQDLRGSLILVNVALIGLAGVLSYILAGWTLRPVEAASERERQFLADASHELRTPLAILRTDLDNALSSSSLTDEERTRLESQREEVDRMSAIVADLLRMARHGETGASRVAPCETHTLVRDLAVRFEKLAKEHRVSIIIEHLDEATVLANREALLQALSNIVKNAVLYNREQGTVTLSTRHEADHVHISVADTGIGIPGDQLEKIFDRFYRVDSSRARATGGSGLGLAIAKEIVEGYGGIISVESLLEKGTKFRITLPIHKAS